MARFATKAVVCEVDKQISQIYIYIYIICSIYSLCLVECSLDNQNSKNVSIPFAYDMAPVGPVVTMKGDNWIVVTLLACYSILKYIPFHSNDDDVDVC